MKNVLFKILGFIFTPKLVEKYTNMKSRIMWNVYQPELKHCGRNSSVQWPLQIHGGKYISIGDNFVAAKYLTLYAFDSYRETGKKYKPVIEIGNNVTVTEFCQISCIERVEIGDGTLLGRNVFIADNGHGIGKGLEKDIPPVERELTSKGPVIIGKNVWIGRNVTILSGVKIGDGVIIGANSVVTRDIPEYSIAVGCPARIIKRIKE